MGLGATTITGGCLSRNIGTNVNQSTTQMGDGDYTSDFIDEYDAINELIVGVGFSYNTNPIGTGWVYDSNKVIVNYHILEDDTEIQIWKEGEGWYPTEIIGTDIISDAVVLRVDGVEFNDSLTLADTNSKIGTDVFSIGFPEQSRYISVSGEISGHNGLYNGPSGNILPDVLFTTARQTNGSSGSPLITPDNEVTGMIGAGSTWTGYAISCELLNRVLPVISEGERYYHPDIPGTYRTVTSEVVDEYGLSGRSGVIVGGLPSDSSFNELIPATEGEDIEDGDNLAGGDVITAVDDNAVLTRGQFISLMYTTYSPNDTIDLTVTHFDGEKETITTTLERLTV